MRRALAAPFAPSRSPSPSLAPRVVAHRASTHLFLISPRSRQPPWRPHRSPRAHRASSDHRPPPAPSRVVVSLARAASMTARLSRANDDRALTLAVRGSRASRTTARRRVRRSRRGRAVVPALGEGRNPLANRWVATRGTPARRARTREGRGAVNLYISIRKILGAVAAMFQSGRCVRAVTARRRVEASTRAERLGGRSAVYFSGTLHGSMPQISLAYWSMVRSELNLPLKAVEMMEDSVQPADSVYAASTRSCASR